MTIQPTFIDVMRHGEPEGSCPRGGTILRGTTDNRLTERGWQQAKNRCQRIIDAEQLSASQNDARPWDVIISSPLVRCAEFAEYLHRALQFPADGQGDSFSIEPQWREINYGDWDGKSTADIWQQQPELMAVMWKDPLAFCAPKGESVKLFGQRLQQAWLDLLAKHQGQRILLVCHGGVMRLLLQQLLMMSPEGMNRFAIPYAAMTRFRIDHSVADDLDSPLQHWPSLLNHYSDDVLGASDAKK